uniref:Uracil catabolism protein 2 n=1 Tax=Lachancea kluyveri TaxID=4934 RepID=URC2_LACKL|nr:RecName: Full=Uracil catabolism protein 2 [Lachancea kluyveri]AAO06875.2 pyrimidine regulating protein [Lachancea kluyveri]
MASDNSQTQTRTKKPRKKRKTYSCGVCRKFKTRCDFEPLVGKCHRCNVLRLECSLTKEREEEILAAVESTSKSTLAPASLVSGQLPALAAANPVVANDAVVVAPVAATLSSRLNKLESSVGSLNSKLDLALMLLQGSNSAISNLKNLTSSKAGMGDRNATYDDDDDGDDDGHDHSDSDNFVNGIKLQEPPLKLISDIDERLFPTKAQSQQDILAKTQRPFVVARFNFLKYFNQHEQLCLDLSRDFLVKSHFWIIPGGIKEINRTYVEKHLFITSVFTIIAMGFDENNKYEKEQEQLYPLVERFLTNTLTMFEKLTDHDIEAILYCSMFNISRKSKRHRQLKFNSLVLCNFAVNSVLNIVDFHKIKERVLINEEYSALDLYHLRILNSLTACRLQYSIGSGNFTIQDDMLKEFNNLTAKFPQANFGDDIKISEINLGDIVNGIFLNFKAYFKGFSKRFRAETRGHADRNRDCLVIPELEYWLKNWDELLSKDGGGVLLFAYDFYYSMICRSFLTEFFEEEFQNDVVYFKCALKTMKRYCFSLLDGFLKLPPSLIKGAPTITLHQLVYACLTLCDFLHCFDVAERQQVLNLCTKIYWHLNTIGEKLNEATDNVGKIIKSLIDTSKRKAQVSGRLAVPRNTKRGSPSMTPGFQQSVQSSSALQGSKAGSPQSARSVNSQGSGADSLAAASFNMPDVAQFNSFEDFFQDFFDNLKPTTQSMFSTLQQQQQ